MLNRFNPSELFNQLPFRVLKSSESVDSIASTTTQNDDTTLLTVDTTDTPLEKTDENVNGKNNDQSSITTVLSPSSSTYQSPVIQPVAAPVSVQSIKNNTDKSDKSANVTPNASPSTSNQLANTAASILSYVGSYWSPINLTQSPQQNNNQPRAKDLLAYINRLKQCEQQHKTNYDKLINLESKYKQMLIDDISRWQRYYIDPLIQLSNKLYGTWLQYLHELIELEKAFLNNINKHIDAISVATKHSKSGSPSQLSVKQQDRLKRALIYATNNTTTFKSSEEIESSFWPSTAHTKKQLCLELYEKAKTLEVQYNNEQKRLLQQETYIQRKTSIRNIVLSGLQNANVLKDDSLYYHTLDTSQQQAFTQRLLDERTSEGQYIRKSIDGFRQLLSNNDTETVSKAMIAFLDSFTVDIKRRYDLPSHCLPALRLYVDRAIFPIIHDIVTVLEPSDAVQYNTQYAVQLALLQQHTILPTQLGIDSKYLPKTNGHIQNDGHQYLYGYEQPIDLLSNMNDTSNYVPTDVLRTVSDVIKYTHICAARNASLLTNDNYDDTTEPAYIQADDLFPLVEYIVIQSNCNKLPFMLSHVQRFLPDTCTAFGPSGMALTIIDAAVRHICSMDVNALANPSYKPTTIPTNVKQKPASHNVTNKSQYNTVKFNIDDIDATFHLFQLNVSHDGTVNVQIT